MRYRVAAALLVLSLAACQKGQEAATPASGSTVAAPATVAAAPVAEVNPLPEGIELDFANRVRSKSVSVDGKRRALVEFKQDDVATIDQRVEMLLLAKGFERYKSTQDGAAVLGYYKKGKQYLTVTTKPSDSAMALDPDSLGTVYFLWSTP